MKGPWLIAGAVAAASCTPSFDDGLSRVDGPRVLAVRLDPPEVKPGEVVTVHALYTESTPLIFDYCAVRRALAEPGSVSAACLDDPSARVAIGVGIVASGAVPRDACRLFGPDRPVGKAGEPAARPADPDATGGYYQPGLVRGEATPGTTFDVRIRCGLPGATSEQLAELERRYRVNANPEIEGLFAGARSLGEGEELVVARRETISLRVVWPACVGEGPCGGAESYVAFDPSIRAILPRREAMRASWLATGGRFVADGTGRSEEDQVRETESSWTAPDVPAVVRAWVVLRDARGGTAFRSFRINVP